MNNLKCDFLVIDTYNMIARAKLPWVKEGRNLLIFSFLRILSSTIDRFKPTKIIMPFDDYVGNNFRRKIFPEYKANRSKKNKKDPFNKEFKRQRDLILGILEKILPVYTLKYKGYEADDLIAAICRIASDEVKIIIWSNDQDLIQLQQKIPNVKIWNPQIRDFSENPEYDIVAFKSLAGDRSDNISGVKGIGKVGAKKALSSNFKFIEMIASNPQRFVEYRKNKRIIDLIDNELPIPDNIDYILNQKVSFDSNSLEKVFQENGFRSIYLNNINCIFLQSQIRNMRDMKKEWFFNKGKENTNGIT